MKRHLFAHKLSSRTYFLPATGMCEWRACGGLLQDAANYHPDTLDLNKDAQAALYWFDCLRQLISKFAKKAAASQLEHDVTAVKRAEQFRLAYLEQLNILEHQQLNNVANNANAVLSIRELLELNERQLRRFGFADPWQQQKQQENNAAIAQLSQRLQQLDNISNPSKRWIELVRGVLAGNMFDWGAQAVTNILETDSNFGLQAALERIEQRPWLMDDLDAWLYRLQESSPHKCAIIFVDNSGVDIVLGILPFARELLKNGTKVLLCANTEPSLNDVTSVELQQLLNNCSYHCTLLQKALAEQQLLVYANGQSGPCLDMRTLPADLCEAIENNETDLLVIEGMGRALHTNLYAKFRCETLKLAVIKNKWLAQRLGGDTFAVICKYEPANNATTSSSKSS